MSEYRKYEQKVEIDAPVEDVWKAITEGDQIVRWFAPDAKVEPGEGGSVWLSWGPGMEGTEKILIWEPNRRFATGHGGDSPKSVEYILEANGNQTILRLVHSGFGADASFDNEYESTQNGWKMFMAILKFGVEGYRDRPARNVTVFRQLSASFEEAWKQINGPDGVSYTPDQVLCAPKPGYLCLIEGDSLLSFFVERCGGTPILTIMVILYGDAVSQADAVRERWTAFADKL